MAIVNGKRDKRDIKNCHTGIKKWEEIEHEEKVQQLQLVL